MQPQSGSAQPDLSALRQVMNQMGQNTGILDQSSPQANVPTPGLPQRQMPMPQMGGGATPPPQPMGQQGPPTGLPVGDPDAQIILKAMSKRLDTLGKLGR